MKSKKNVKNITFSMPVELIRELTVAARGRELSKFVAEAVRKAIDERNRVLRLAYAEDAKDPDTAETFKEWSVLDGEGLDEDE